MRVCVSLFLLVFVLSYSSIGQDIKVNSPGSAEYYLQVLKTSKDSLYAKIIGDYNDYLAIHDIDFLTSIERCKIVEKAYYDQYEDYNPNYEEFEKYLKLLVEKFPDVPEVRLYKSKKLYGDSAISYQKEIIVDSELNPQKWKDKPVYEVYVDLARNLSYQDEIEEATFYGELAEKKNDTLDISLFLGEQYKRLNKYDKALEYLLRPVRTSEDGWDLNRRANMLLELGHPKEALDLFNLAKKDSASWISNGQVANALIESGFYLEAREYLLKDMADSYNKLPSMHKLLRYDLKYSPADSAVSSYTKLIDENFLNDIFGRYRAQLFFKNPALGWSWYDLLRIFSIILVIVIAFAIPYLWILPIYYLGSLIRKKGYTISDSGFRWKLKDFWVVSFLLIMAELISLSLFDYESFVLSLTDDYYTDEENKISVKLANFALTYFTISFIIAMVHMKKVDFINFWGGTWSKVKMIVVGIGSAILLRGIYFAFHRKFAIAGLDSEMFFSVTDYILSINTFYSQFLGFCIVVIIVPFYEEVIFRGIFFSASKKHLMFVWANLIQAVIFAALHDQITLFPFYVVFGLIAGYLTLTSKSLVAGICMHMTNNLFAFYAITNL